ncbi:MAG: DUF2079 domain-containing protein [bacterium]|nr:DUF2079 domain-containing protein [bacterium]
MIVILNHYFFRTYTWDYGAYNFAFYDFAHLRLSPNLISRVIVPWDVHFLQDHISFTLPLLSPLFWVMNGMTHSYSLLIIQWGFIVFGAWATFKLVELKSNSQYLALLSVVYYYVLYGRYSSYQGDCNLAILGASVLPGFFYFFEAGKLKASMLCFAFLCLNREDMPLCLIFISLFLMIVYRKDRERFRWAGIFALLSILYFVVVFTVLIPFFEDQNKKFNLFDYGILGENPLKALTFVLTHPLKATQYLFVNHLNDAAFDWVKTSFYVLYGVCGGFLLFKRPLYFLCLIPFVAKKMFNDSPQRWGYENYYSIEFVCLLPLFIFSILAEFKNERLRYGTAITICVISLLLTAVCLKESLNGGLGNRKINFFSSNFYKSEQNVSSIHKLLKLIPAQTPLCASSDLIPHLSERKKIFYYPYTKECEYVCVNKMAHTYPATQQQFNSEFNNLLKSKSWRLLAVTGDVYLFRRAN